MQPSAHPQLGSRQLMPDVNRCDINPGQAKRLKSTLHIGFPLDCPQYTYLHPICKNPIALKTDAITRHKHIHLHKNGCIMLL